MSETLVYLLFFLPTGKLLEWLFSNYFGARTGSESVAHEAEGRMDYWLRGHEGERNSCFSKIQLVGQKLSRQNNFSRQNTIQPPLFWFSKPVLFTTSGL